MVKHVHLGDSKAHLFVSPSAKGEKAMRDDRRRLILATLFAVAAGVFVYAANPADRIKADLRADAKGFVLSLEYSAKLLKV
jgi:hypothetical protein